MLQTKRNDLKISENIILMTVNHGVAGSSPAWSARQD